LINLLQNVIASAILRPSVSSSRIIPIWLVARPDLVPADVLATPRATSRKIFD
jgi:hypothetical protein